MKSLQKVLALSVSALALAAPAQAQVDQAPAYLIKGSKAAKVWLKDATKKAVRYTTKKGAVNFKDERLASVKVYFLQPDEFTEAMLAYQSRDYAGAQKKFGECVKAYKRFEEVQGNYSTLARFYEMECARKQDNLTALGSMMSKFISKPLVNEDHRLQIEINEVFWDAVKKKAWSRLIAVAEDPKWQDRKLPGSIRAQIAYVTGLSYEAEEKTLKALNAYNRAFTADFAASEVIARKAALACFRMLDRHEATKLAKKLYGTDDYSDRSEGAFYLKEGAALISLWDKSLGGGKPLPAEYNYFKKFAKKS